MFLFQDIILTSQLKLTKGQMFHLEDIIIQHIQSHHEEFTQNLYSITHTMILISRKITYTDLKYGIVKLNMILLQTIS